MTVSLDGYIRINYGHLDQYPEARQKLRDVLKKHLAGQSLQSVTDLTDDELAHKFPSISAAGMPRYVDMVIAAFDEFMQWARSGDGNQ